LFYDGRHGGILSWGHYVKGAFCFAFTQRMSEIQRGKSTVKNASDITCAAVSRNHHLLMLCLKVDDFQCKYTVKQFLQLLQSEPAIRTGPMHT